ncbi:MAG: hypothetical protein KGZ25_03835, partial [Planctomycetes bacterium]|nr:hypothetical protein [Planctomycetota bacterium]
MTSDEDKNREELLKEVRRLRAQLADLEGQEAEHNELVSRLKISKERFQAVTENANDCVWELDENFVYTFVTSQF